MREELKQTYDVFLSYSSLDKTWADAACAVLERQRVRCWIAPRDITPGDEWGASIIKGIDGSRMMVLIFSGHANASKQVRREVDRAISRGMTVMPIRIDDVRPEGSMEFFLSSTHWMDALTPPDERHLEMIAQSVKTLLRQQAESVATLMQAEPPPDASKRSLSTGDKPRLLHAALPIGIAASLLAVLAVIFITIQSRNTASKIAQADDKGVKVKADVAVPNHAPATDVVAKPSASPTEMRKEKLRTLALPNTHSFYIDNFNVNSNRRLETLDVPPKPNPGQASGVFYIYAPPHVWRGWDIHRFDSDSTCEVIGRVLTDNSSASAWSVLVLNTSGSGRGIRVNINVKGELLLDPTPWPSGKDFLQIDPRIGPIGHPAIKPGYEYNKLLLIVRKREVTIVVNDAPICGSVKLSYDLTPCKLQLGVAGPGKKRAEFDRVEIREIIDSGTGTSKGQDGGRARQPNTRT